MPANLATSFEDAWQRFRALNDLELAVDWTEPKWTLGRAQLLAFVIRIESPSVREYADGVLGKLAGVPCVEPFPEEYRHITVKLAGFQVIKRTHNDDILREEVTRIGKNAGEALAGHAAYEAVVGPPNGFRDVVFLEVHDGGRARELNATLADIPGVARYASDGIHFLPHMSIARFKSDKGLDELKATLADIRTAAPGPSFDVGRVDFVKAWLTEPVPEFETLAGLRLAAP